MYATYWGHSSHLPLRPSLMTIVLPIFLLSIKHHNLASIIWRAYHPIAISVPNFLNSPTVSHGLQRELPWSSGALLSSAFLIALRNGASSGPSH